jgi:hypothetical protein
MLSETAIHGMAQYVGAAALVAAVIIGLLAGTFHRGLLRRIGREGMDNPNIPILERLLKIYSTREWLIFLALSAAFILLVILAMSLLRSE